MSSQSQSDDQVRSFARYFGAVIVVVLLGIYSSTVYIMVHAVVSCQEQAAVQPAGGTSQSPYSTEDCINERISQGTILISTTVGGLVSALVVAVLGATPPGESPSRLVLSRNAGEFSRQLGNVIVILYLLVWIVTGLAALFFGLISYAGLSSTLADIGTTWLGIAVATGYAYFGIKPQ